MADPANSVAVATGSLIVTGNLTSFIAVDGDLFIAGGAVAEIASRDSGTQLTLKQPWAGATLQGATTWNVLSLGPYWRSAISTNKQLAELIGKWDAGPVKWDASGTIAQRDQYNNQPNDFVYLAVDPLPWRLYVKLANTNSAADWSAGQILGDRGPVAFEEAIDRVQADIDQKVDTTGDAGATTVQALGATNVRKQSDRANDFVMMADDMSSSATFFQAVAMAKARLKLKDGGRLRYPRGGLDCGTQVYTEADNRIIHEGEVSTVLYSARPDAPLFVFQSASGSNRSGMANLQVASTVARSTPLIRVVNGYGSSLVAVEASAAAACPVAFDIDGGSNCYNVRLVGIRSFGPFGSLVRVGANAQVQNLTLTGGWQAGDTTNAAVLLLDVSGMTIGAGEALVCLRGIAAQPGPGKAVLCVQIGAGVLLDTSIMEAFYLSDDGGYIETITSTGLWCCSSGGNRGAATKYPNVFIAASAAGHIRRIGFESATIGNSSSHGAVVLIADDVTFAACHADGNGANGTGDGYFIGNGARNVTISAGSARGAFTQRAPFAPFQRYAVNIDVDTDGIGIVNRLDAAGNLAGTVSSFSNGTNNSLGGFYA